jgi:hypothetical protein
LSYPTDVEIERARIRIQNTIDAFVAAMAPGALPDNPFCVAFRGASTQDIDAFKLALKGLDALAREREHPLPARYLRVGDVIETAAGALTVATITDHDIMTTHGKSIALCDVMMVFRVQS